MGEFLQSIAALAAEVKTRRVVRMDVVERILGDAIVDEGFELLVFVLFWCEGGDELQCYIEAVVLRTRVSYQVTRTPFCSIYQVSFYKVMWTDV